MNKSYVVAGNMDEFRQFVNRKKVEYDKSTLMMPRYIFVHSTATIRGLSEVHGWFTGTYEQRSDIEEIKATIKVINFSLAMLKGKTITGVWLDEIEANIPMASGPMYINSSN